MESVYNMEDVQQLQENEVRFSKECEDVQFDNTKIVFKGKNNILYIQNGVHIKDSTILFEGDNSVVYLSRNKNVYLLNLTLYNHNAFYMGYDTYMNGKINAILSERKHILIGNRCLFSFGIWMRLADPHLIYDCETKQRKNPSKSIFLGDHVWVGQSAMLLKGMKVGSGSIIGAMALASGKTIPSNTSWGGNPMKHLGSKVFFTGDCVHRYNEQQTEESMKYEGDEFIYHYEEGVTKSFSEIDEALSACANAKEMLSYLKKEIRKNKEKNRFFVAENKKSVFKKGEKKVIKK